DRSEFIGTTGSVDRPEVVLAGKALSGTVEAGRDPCAALALDIEVGPGEAREIVFLLGNAADQRQAKALINETRKVSFGDRLAAAKQQWEGLFDRVQVKTPDPAFDVLVNGWLPYQAIACRIWARAAFYQASGAFGFRAHMDDRLAVLACVRCMGHEQGGQAASAAVQECHVQRSWFPARCAGAGPRLSGAGGRVGHGASLDGGSRGRRAIGDERP